MRLSSSRWNETTPEWFVPLTVRQAMRSFSFCSVISASHWRLLNQIFSSHFSLSGSSPSPSSYWTLSTRCMNFGNSSHSVHFSYASSTGTATSVQRWIGRRRVFLPSPPPPLSPPPKALEASLPNMPPPAPCASSSFAPFAPALPASSATLEVVSLPFSRSFSPPSLTLDAAPFTAPARFAPRTAAAVTALAASGMTTCLLFSGSRSDVPTPCVGEPLRSSPPPSSGALDCGSLSAIAGKPPCSFAVSDDPSG